MFFIQAGYSLIELMIAVCITAILSSLALPALQAVYQRINDENQLGQLLQTLEQAEREAIVRRLTVAVCGSQNQKSCSGHWATGMLIFADIDADGVIHQQSQILAVKQSRTTEGTLHWRAFPFYHPVAEFYPTGLLQSDNGTFWYCHRAATKPVWAVTINKFGMVRAIHPNRKGQITDAHGRLLSC